MLLKEGFQGLFSLLVVVVHVGPQAQGQVLPQLQLPALAGIGFLVLVYPNIYILFTRT